MQSVDCLSSSLETAQTVSATDMLWRASQDISLGEGGGEGGGGGGSGFAVSWATVSW